MAFAFVVIPPLLVLAQREMAGFDKKRLAPIRVVEDAQAAYSPSVGAFTTPSGAYVSSRTVVPLMRWWAAQLGPPPGEKMGEVLWTTALPLLIYREISPQHWLGTGSGYEYKRLSELVGKRCIAVDGASP